MKELVYGPFLEIWKPVKNFPDYDISSYGRVKSFKCNKEKILKLSKNGRDYILYYSVKLNNNDTTKTLAVHRLVAQYIPNPFNLPFVNHKDGNPLNNFHLNLEWVTSIENNCHKQDKTKTSSKYIGVTWCKLRKKWKSRITINTNTINLGHFNAEIEAYQVRCDFEKNNNVINKYL